MKTVFHSISQIKSFAIVLLLTLFISGCGNINSALRSFNNSADEAIASFDDAIAALQHSSGEWQLVVQNLQEQLTEDLQSIISHEVQDLAQTTVHSSGLELRCNAEYMAVNLRRQLIKMRNDLAESINTELDKSSFASYQITLIPEEEIKPYICNVVPSIIDVDIEAKRRAVLHIYGFDLKSKALKVGFRSQGLFQATQASSRTSPGPFSDTIRIASSSDRLASGLTSVAFARELRQVSENMWANMSVSTEAFTILNHASLFFTDISSSVYFISDFHAVVDLAESGADLPPNANELVISCGMEILSELPIISHEKILECNVRTVTIDPPPGQLTFKPDAIGFEVNGKVPDKDFDDHGPCMEFWIKLFIGPERKKLYAQYFLDARECDISNGSYKKDYTRAVGNGYKEIWSVKNENDKILDFDVRSYESGSHKDKEWESYTHYYGGNSLLDRVVYWGDTQGEDAGIDTRIIFHFNTIKLNIETCGYK